MPELDAYFLGMALIRALLACAVFSLAWVVVGACLTASDLRRASRDGEI